VNFRGNVQTRLKKLQEGIVDATMLAKVDTIATLTRTLTLTLTTLTPTPTPTLTLTLSLTPTLTPTLTLTLTLTQAGLNRMNLDHEITAVLEWDTCLPAVAQATTLALTLTLTLL